MPPPCRGGGIIIKTSTGTEKMLHGSIERGTFDGQIYTKYNLHNVLCMMHNRSFSRTRGYKLMVLQSASAIQRNATAIVNRALSSHSPAVERLVNFMIFSVNTGTLYGWTVRNENSVAHLCT